MKSSMIPMPRIVEPTTAMIESAAASLRAGEVVAFPTETVYGLGGDTFSPRAITRIYELKGRPADNPLIAHALDAEQARRLTSRWDARCESLAVRFWPGPLTLVLPRAPAVPRDATAGHDTIGVRCPDHPVARRLLEAFGSPISAPSANRSGHVSPTTAHHVADDFAEVAGLLILDGGPCQVGIESTVLDLTSQPARVLRPGGVTIEQLREVIGEVEQPMISTQQASPGTAISHYAPNTPAALMDDDQLRAALRSPSPRCVVLCFDPSMVSPPHHAIQMPRNAEAYASRLYDALRAADALNGDRIIIERPPETGGIWRAVHDRLRRATARR